LKFSAPDRGTALTHDSTFVGVAQKLQFPYYTSMFLRRSENGKRTRRTERRAERPAGTQKGSRCRLPFCVPELLPAINLFPKYYLAFPIQVFTPPWLEHAPLLVSVWLNVPSLQIAVVPGGADVALLFESEAVVLSFDPVTLSVLADDFVVFDVFVLLVDFWFAEFDLAFVLPAGDIAAPGDTAVEGDDMVDGVLLFALMLVEFTLEFSPDLFEFALPVFEPPPEQLMPKPATKISTLRDRVFIVFLCLIL
jgi:hypothetical protein